MNEALPSELIHCVMALIDDRCTATAVQTTCWEWRAIVRQILSDRLDVYRTRCNLWLQLRESTGIVDVLMNVPPTEGSYSSLESALTPATGRILRSRRLDRRPAVQGGGGCRVRREGPMRGTRAARILSSFLLLRCTVHVDGVRPHPTCPISLFSPFVSFFSVRSAPPPRCACAARPPATGARRSPRGRGGARRMPRRVPASIARCGG